jgi:hypothetical protein
MTSTITQEAAAAAAKRILGFYPDIPASDPKGFAAGLVQTLMTFPEAVVKQAMDPVHGLPAKVEFLNLAAMRKCLDQWRLEHLAHEERVARSKVRYLPEPPRDPEEMKRISDGFKKLSEHLARGFSPGSI